MSRNILETIDMQQLGRELQSARKKSGMTQGAAAKVIDVARTTITAIEKGERRISPGELIKLAHAYGRQVGDFVRPRPIVQAFEVRFRGPYQVSDKDNADIQKSVSDVQELCRDYLELEKITGAPAIRNYPREYRILESKNNQALETIAIEERRRLGFADNPIPNLRDTLEREVGLRVFYVPLPSRFSEIYHYDDQLGACIAVNVFHPKERRRLSLAHGYAHFLVHRHRPGTFIEGDYQRMPEEERVADVIAFYLLMPSSSVIRYYSDLREQKGKVTVAGLCIMAGYFGVSVEAITRRLEEMHLVPTGTWDKVKEGGWKMRELQQQLGVIEPVDPDDLLPLRYKYLAYSAFERELVTEAQFARFLRVDRFQARQIARDLGREVGTIESDDSRVSSSGAIGH